MIRNLVQFIRELFYRREVEIFWDPTKPDIYGIRETYRSRLATGELRWRVYSKRGCGNTIRLTTDQMRKLLEDANGFVKDRTKGRGL